MPKPGGIITGPVKRKPAPSHLDPAIRIQATGAPEDLVPTPPIP